MASEPLPPPAPPDRTTTGPAVAPPGWYADPHDPTAWRWWDGRAWTMFTSRPTGPRRPRLPRWLSPPVLACGIVVALGLVVIAIGSPVSLLAGVIPLFIVLPVLRWLDRVEPEPASSRIHAILWGGTVAVLVSLIVNVVTIVVVGELVAMVVSAPLIEEAMKAMGVIWAVRRRELDGISDGIVYAGWVALGFAVVEDVTYFVSADVEGALLGTVILRGVLTPFAHPLFTFWSGLAIGRAVARSTPVFPSMWWGYGLAVLTHGAWNGTLALGDLAYTDDPDVGVAVILAGIVLFGVLFAAVAVALFLFRRREQQSFVAGVGRMVMYYGLTPAEASMFTGWKPMLAARRRLPRARRRDFDRVHAALARLVALHGRTDQVDLADERVLAEQLTEALTRYRTPR